MYREPLYVFVAVAWDRGAGCPFLVGPPPPYPEASRPASRAAGDRRACPGRPFSQGRSLLSPAKRERETAAELLCSREAPSPPGPPCPRWPLGDVALHLHSPLATGALGDGVVRVQGETGVPPHGPQVTRGQLRYGPGGPARCTGLCFRHGRLGQTCPRARRVEGPLPGRACRVPLPVLGALALGMTRGPVREPAAGEADAMDHRRPPDVSRSSMRFRTTAGVASRTRHAGQRSSSGHAQRGSTVRCPHRVRGWPGRAAWAIPSEVDAAQTRRLIVRGPLGGTRDTGV